MERKERLIPRTMSTQHPDNANTPFFATNGIIGTDEEITEAYFVFSELGCQEQMWDFEGKKTAPWVISELLSKNQNFFNKHPLGKELFLTFRIPNPEIEKLEAKLVSEILENITRCYDIYQTVYQNNCSPVFEVILPMTTSAKQLNRVFYYYKNFVIKKKNLTVFPGDDISIGDWLGNFEPDIINVIPLFEDCDSLINSAKITEAYLIDKELDYQRVFLARSDPALNYGSLAAILSLNIALKRLEELQKRIGVTIYPILGVGSAPFRGNFKPTTVERLLRGYPSCQTFTIQSAFKYDWPIEEVKKAVKTINSKKRGIALPVDEKSSLFLIKKTIKSYQEQIPEVALLVNKLSSFIPKRRLRKLHIGLFGYSRGVSGIHLPRAITFCAVLYSIGLPPDILGLHSLNWEEIKIIREVYPSPYFEDDLRAALKFYNPKVLSLLSPTMKKQIKKALRVVDFEIDKEHQKITSAIIGYFQQNKINNLSELITKSGQVRGFLG